mgnify:CR=1 FL=1
MTFVMSFVMTFVMLMNITKKGWQQLCVIAVSLSVEIVTLA